MQGQDSPPMDPDHATLGPKARRMTAVATLARPVQHDINNLLTVVFANLELLKRTAAAGGPQRQLDRIHEAARRLDGSTRSLLTLLRRSTDGAAPVCLADVLTMLQPLLALLLPSASGLSLSLAAGDPRVRLDRTALEDGLLGLAQEIAERMPRGAGLGLELAHDAGLVTLTVVTPAGLELPAIAALAAVGEEAGGRAERRPDGIHLSLPALPAAP
ncbi:histidine kinase dimerization/phospho-acceptor domain-containing protein [Paeniroseomonas aquatica]